MTMTESGPTLLRKGMVIGTDSKNIRAIDYLLRILDERVAHNGMFPRGVKKASDRFLVLESGTGSGKSTTLPPEIFLKFQESLKGRLAITQPRIINTIQIAESIPRFYKDMKFGQNIGYSTGFIKRLPRFPTSVVYMTLPTIYNQIINMTEEKFLNKYSFIILDEVHERSIETDLTIKLLKQIVHRNWKKPECPNIIVMSATFDYNRFSKYFGGCKIVRVRGEDGFAIREMWPKIDPTDYETYIYDKVIENHEKINKPTPNDNILIFLHKSKAISSLIKRFDEYNRSQPSAGYIAPIPLTSATFKEGIKTLTTDPADIRFDVDGKEVTPARKVIVTTNLAETGVTFTDIRFVFDSGYYLSVDFNPSAGTTQIIMVPVTQGMSRQRRGRIGRVAPGEFWPSYTRKTFEKMLKDQYSDIIRSDITSGVLAVISQDMKPNDENDWDGDPRDPFKEFNGLLDPPGSTSFYYSLEKLILLGFLTPSLKPTALGLVCRNFGKIAMEMARSIMCAYYTGATPMSIVNIAAIFSSMGFATRNARPPKAYGCSKCLLKPEIIQCSMITALLQFEDFLMEIEKQKKLSFITLEKWCDDHGYIFQKLIDIMAVRDEIIDKLIEMDFDPFTGKFGRSPRGRAMFLTELSGNETQFMTEVKRIKRALYEGHKLNVFRRVGDSFMFKGMYRPIKIMAGKDHANARYIMANSISFMNGKFKGDGVSTLDGWVIVDDDMFLN
jgi:HrpA-like RNA helicase